MSDVGDTSTRPDAAAAGRRPGAAQALSIIVANAMPILAQAALVPSLPLLLKHFASVPGANYLVPLILTIPTLCLGFLSSFGGMLADRFGRRRVMLCALLVYAIAGTAPVFMEDLTSILVARLALGLAETCIPSSGNALLGDYFTGDSRRRWISLEMMLGPLIGSIMLVSGGFLGTVSWHAPFLLYAFGFVPLIAVSFFVWEPERQVVEVRRADASGFPWPRAALVAGVTFLAGFPFFAQNVQHGRIFAGLGVQSTADISLYATIASAGTILGAYFYRRHRFAHVSHALALSFGCFAISFMTLSTHPTLWVGTPIDGIGQFAGGLCYTATLAWAVGSFQEQYRARGIGVWLSSFYLGSPVSALVIEYIRGPTGDFLHAIGIVGAIYGVFAVALVVARLMGFRRGARPEGERPGLA